MDSDKDIDRDTQRTQWAFTLNFDETTRHDRELQLGNLKRHKNIKDWIYQIEKGEETGHLHFQGYATFKNGIRFKTLKNLMPSANIEKPRASLETNLQYCSKEKTRQEPTQMSEGFKEKLKQIQKGTKVKRGNQGQRSDLLDSLQLLEQTGDLEQIRTHYPQTYVKYIHHFKTIQTDLDAKLQRPNDAEIKIWWLETPESGVGKTRGSLLFLEENGIEYHTFQDKQNNNWWDGYDKQQWVLINELCPKQIDYGFIKRLFDGGKLQAGKHGGMINILATKFIVTTNYPVEELWHDPNYEPIRRRLKDYGHILPRSIVVQCIGKLKEGSLDEYDIPPTPERERQRIIADWIKSTCDPSMIESTAKRIVVDHTPPQRKQKKITVEQIEAREAEADLPPIEQPPSPSPPLTTQEEIELIREQEQEDADERHTILR